MSRVDAANAGALLLALIASVLAAKPANGATEVRVEQVAPHAAAIAEVALPDGTRGVRDAAGTVAPIRSYARVASASIIADQLLWALCAPERVVAVSARSKRDPTLGSRYATHAALESPAELETILSLHPDLLIVNYFGDPRYAARLRARGIVVFDLGEMHGIASLLPDIAAIGALLGERARADALARRFMARMRSVAAGVPEAHRLHGLYLSAYGKQLYGGSRGTSYHDVLRYAGLIDVAAGRYAGWPTFDAEQVIDLDPDVLVTKRGMGRTLCAFPGLSLLRACHGGARIVELDPELADDPGLRMLDAAEDLRDAVYGPYGR